MTIEEKLNSIRETKEAIKTSIRNKGVELEDTAPFNTYPSKIDEITTEVETENIEITPTKQEQIVNRSEDKYIESVTVNAIPDEYIIPSGELEIIENGNYDVTDKASVNVEIASSGGVDISEYFDGTLSDGNSGEGGWRNTLLKFPALENTGTSCKHMFEGCPAQQIDLSKINTKNVTDMRNMFYGCSKLTSLDVSNFDTSKVRYMGKMFFGCTKLTSLDLSNFNTENVTTMDEMFRNGYELTEIKGLNNFNTSKVTNMNYMFQACSKLTNLDVSSFDTSNCTSFNYMFDNNFQFDTLNIENFDFSKVEGSSSKNVLDIFRFYTNLVNLTFGINFGKGFTRKSANYSYSKLDLSQNVNLSHNSLMDVINKLYDLNLTYDVANGGTLYTQQLVLGATNIAKLTEEEMAIATAKGWTIS